MYGRTYVNLEVYQNRRLYVLTQNSLKYSNNVFFLAYIYIVLDVYQRVKLSLLRMQ
jgi:hypothetical protein